MGKRTVEIEGWKVQLRVRVQRKKRVRLGRTRGRYEGKTAHLTIWAPMGKPVTIYLGSGEMLKAELRGRRNGGKKSELELSSSSSPARGEERGRKQRVADADRARVIDDAKRGRYSPRVFLGELATTNDEPSWARRRRK